MPPARAHLRLPAGLPRRRRPRDVRDGRLPADGLAGVAARARLHRRPLPQQGGEVRAAAGRQDAAAQGYRLHDLLPRRGAAPHHHTRNFLLEYSGTPPLAPQVACTPYGWADPALCCLGYNWAPASNRTPPGGRSTVHTFGCGQAPGRLQQMIRTVFELATKKIRVPGERAPPATIPSRT